MRPRPALLALLAGCAMIDESSRPADWPQLEMAYYETGFPEMHRICEGNLLVQTLACAKIDFKANRCTIVTTDKPIAYILAHEKKHCAGYDHVGSTLLRDEWEKFKSARYVETVD